MLDYSIISVAERRLGYAPPVIKSLRVSDSSNSSALNVLMQLTPALQYSSDMPLVAFLMHSLFCMTICAARVHAVTSNIFVLNTLHATQG